MTYPKVFDMENVERDWPYIEEKYGIAFRRGSPNERGEIYRLVSVHEKTGHSSLITQVLDENGLPVDRQGVAFYWPGAPDPPEPSTTLLPHDWFPNFVHGPTNLNGDVGPGMGTGAYHGRGQGGPHAVWVRDADIPSDICEKLGMLAGTFHDHLDQKFQLVTGDEPDLPDLGELEIVDTIIVEDAPSNMLYIAYPAGISYNTDIHAYSDVQEDIDTAPLEEYEYKGKKFARGGVCANFEGDMPRHYTLFAYHLQTGPKVPITPTISYEFQPLGTVPKKNVTVIVDWKQPEPPPSPPPPPPSPSPQPKWTITIETKPGIPLLIGKMPRAGIQILVIDPRGPQTIVISGSKPEYGPGGWELNIWGRGIFVLEFEDQRFEVPVERQTVIATFEEDAGPQQARLVSAWMDEDQAEALLQALEEQHPDTFSLES